MVTVTPGPSYNEARAESLLRPLQDQLEPAIRILETHGSLTKTARDTRRNPGRGYVLSDKSVSLIQSIPNTVLPRLIEKIRMFRFFSGFEGVVSKRTCRDAENQLIDLAKEEDDVWPLKVESGSMMTLLELVSQDLVCSLFFIRIPNYGQVHFSPQSLSFIQIDLSIDITPTNELRDPNDYETRKASKSSIEHILHFSFPSDFA